MIYDEFSFADTCSYLKDRNSKTEYKIILNMTTQNYSEYLKRGYRRFGIFYFRPTCIQCTECVPYRVILEKFSLRPDMKRCIKKNSHITYKVSTPTFSSEKFSLYERYHQFQTTNVGWAFDGTTENSFYETFFIATETAREFTYYDGNKLVGLGFVDEVDDAISSIYFVHEPEYRQVSLGMFSILMELEWAKKHNKKYLYLGYYIKDCRSMSYKRRYRPGERLIVFPEADQEPIWRKMEEGES